MDVSHLQERLQAFADERDWEQYHAPKNLVMALTGEAGELAEQLQWLTEAESDNLDENTLEDVRRELADVQIYVLRLADRLDIDLEAAVEDKMAENEEKYPVEKAKGSAEKYTEFD